MTSTTGRIFSILRQRQNTVMSGEAVSAALGISRVAVWKQVKKLQTMGCRIQAGPGGYRLLAETDHPFPWTFPEREDRIHYFPTLPSTMEKARDMARKGCDAYSVVIAEAQTNGRGRLERTWLSPESDRVRFINIGIGINVNNAPPADLPAATSVRALTGKNASRRAFLAAYLDALESRLESGDLKNVMQEWKSRTVTLGRPVTIRTSRRTTRGKAVDIDENGALIVEKTDGSREKIVYGDCFHDPTGKR